jgi:hypothetical protein
MTRLILFVLLVAAVALALASVITAMRSFGSLVSGVKGVSTTMPDTFRTIAYVLLIILMFGVATGWLGAA